MQKINMLQKNSNRKFPNLRWYGRPPYCDNQNKQ